MPKPEKVPAVEVTIKKGNGNVEVYMNGVFVTQGGISTDNPSINSNIEAHLENFLRNVIRGLENRWLEVTIKD
ncbi:MAG: hypothetical protein PHY72_00175 [Candidatus Pacebacteria bacterium]|nr:hypothetical protein [Candidatus Paceibacterota bacterium]